ncbi:hypothetical protein CONPUDRAFT_156611 [Coniophora puteana RWD-64-598 SS2]|uniref:F-box domain-containing protein n=1 Tax=Coniophora puteana (strain RWD-64-598) TaxID=741705 RepID=A0A5M3MJ29_CONPW|nr:uncharacterized protein CONPUDRAFT_156611 [Coniophora puteana RWD-64-598 SS2]EIW78645.1 hypothetical protein CONPUDRAFT_156611 [Coniophora puteana RWD-64-598 SS2]
MHHALTVSDILLEIFLQLAQRGDVGSLAVLARTCQTFKDPALNLAWELPQPLSRLTTILPKHVLVCGEEGKTVNTRPLSSAEWDLFYGYTSRIREITVSERGPTVQSLLRLLASRPTAIDCAFPKLRRLTIEESEDVPESPEYRSLLGPKLESLELNLFSKVFEDEVVEGSGGAAAAAINALPDVCPDLRHLAFSWSTKIHTTPTWAVETLSYVVPQLRHLQILRCPAPDINTMNAIGLLPSLEVFTLESSPINAETPGAAMDIMDASPPYEFNHLRTLKYTFEHIINAIAFSYQLQNFPSSLSISLCIPPPLPLLRMLLRVLGQFPISDMHTIKLKQECTRGNPEGYIDDGDDLREPVTLNVLRPLLSHVCLSTLEIDVKLGFALTDGDIDDLSLAWPNLQHLALIQKAGWEEPTVTTQGLYSLVRNCSCLKRLEITINASQLVAVPSAIPAYGHRNDLLDALNLQDSRIGDPVVLSMILARLFSSSSFSLLFGPEATLSTGRLTQAHRSAVMYCIEQRRTAEIDSGQEACDSTWPPSGDVVAKLERAYNVNLGLTR